MRIWRDYSPVDLTGGRKVTTGSSGSVRFLLFHCRQRSRAHLGSMRDGERGPADPVDGF